MNWDKFLNGDFENANAQNYEKQWIDKATEHLLNIDEYVKFYNKDNYKRPPEFDNGFPVDIRLNKIIEIIVLNNFKTLLDVGCRVGFLLFKTYMDNNIIKGVGLDINKSAINLCNRYKKEINATNLYFSETLFEKYEDDFKYDCVIMTDILEHCINPEFFLQKAHNFSNNLIMSFPTDCPQGNGSIPKPEYREHVRLLTKDKIKKLLKSTNWGIEKIFNVSCYFSTDIYLLKNGYNIKDSHSSVEIVKAEWGIDGNLVDVTKLIKSQQDSLGHIFLHIDNDFMGFDPVFGLEKKLKVFYKLDNKDCEIEVHEGQDFILGLTNCNI